MKLGFTVMKLGFTVMKLGFTVIPAQAGIQIAALVSRLRGNDVTQKLRFDKARASKTNVGSPSYRGTSPDNMLRTCGPS
jgi:hypothetical protein